MSNNVASSGGTTVGLTTLLTVAFVVLKLCHVIDWSWWWILAPTWIPVALFLAFLIVWGIALLIAAKYDHRKK